MRQAEIYIQNTLAGIFTEDENTFRYLQFDRKRGII